MKICLISVEIFAWGKYGGFGRATRIIGRELAKRGMEVFAVVPRRNGQKAVDMARRTPPDILLVDVHLGSGMDGLEAARQIVERADCSIIVLTAYDDRAVSARAAQLHAVSVLSKPIDFAGLEQALALASESYGC